MNTRLMLAVGTVVCCMSSSAVFADELILASDSVSKKGAQVISLDLLSDGQAAGVEARINVQAPKGARVDTSNCAKAAPKSHIASCVYNGKEVVVLLYSMKNESLPSGMIDLGTIHVEGVRAGVAKAAATPVVTKFLAAAADGNVVDSKVHAAE